MQYDVITIFPDSFPGALTFGVTGKALKAGLIALNAHNLRSYTTDKHGSVDDLAYGGGAGMVMTPQPLLSAIRAIKKTAGRTILLTPSGRKFSHIDAKRLSAYPQLLLVCGRYEGVDQRVIEAEIDEEFSIGDFVMTGGELPAMMIIDAVSRFIPGVVGNENSPKQESFVEQILEHPHYTRPAEIEGMRVPEVLLSGDHAKIEKWRHEESLKRTSSNRPDLITEPGKTAGE